MRLGIISNLIHTQPGVSLGTVSHNAVVASESEHHASSEAVAVNGSNCRDWGEKALQTG